MSSATVGGLNSLQAVHLKQNVTLLAPPQNKKRRRNDFIYHAQIPLNGSAVLFKYLVLFDV